jgi:imidazolonepropionase-like amidohydrolase
LLALAICSIAGAAETSRGAPLPAAGTLNGPGLAIRAAKILTVSQTGPQVFDNGVLLIKDGRIADVGPSGSLEVPEDFVELDVGRRWLMPGIVELHNHIASGALPFPADINDMVYLANPELRASAAVVPDNSLLRRGVAGGVTTALFIPGSGTNIGGQGVLLKIGLRTYEEMELRNPGSLKIAQSGNPESFTIGVNRSFMNWNTRHTIERGLAYARAWSDFEQGKGERPEKNIQWEVFRDLAAKRTQASVHTQIYQVVLMTVTMLGRDFGLDAFIDHGEFDGFLAAGLAEKYGVQAILGPRSVCPTYPGFVDTDGKVVGMAAAYAERGHTCIGFNTDCVDNGRFITPPQEEISLQAGMGVRYGLDNKSMAAIRGLTINPARAAGIADRVGSLEPGKDADVVVLSGDPADPRTAVERVYTNGELIYDTASERRRW